MRQYGCLKAIVLSFYSRNLYRDVVENWSGGVVLYLLLLLTLCWSVLAFGMQKSITEGYVVISSKFVPQLPVMVLKNGELSTPEQRPYLIKDPDAKDKNKEVFAIIDTSGKYTSLDNSDAGILVTKNAIFYKENKVVKSQSFASDIDLEIKPIELQKSGKIFVRWSWVLFFPVIIFFGFFYRVIEAAIYALFGKIFAALAEIPLTYGELFKISIFALTPSIIMGTLLAWFSITFNHEWVLFLLLTLGYIVFGMGAMKKPTKGT
jgi:hypothetical protein